MLTVSITKIESLVVEWENVSDVSVLGVIWKNAQAHVDFISAIGELVYFTRDDMNTYEADPSITKPADCKKWVAYVIDKLTRVVRIINVYSWGLSCTTHLTSILLACSNASNVKPPTTETLRRATFLPADRIA